MPRYSLLVRNNNFNTLENLEAGINMAHEQGKQLYLAANLSAHNDKIRSFVRDMEPIIAMEPDALIMSDYNSLTKRKPVSALSSFDANA